MRFARIDQSHLQVVKALRAAGMSVQSLAAVGKGCPDLVVGHSGFSFLVEIKSKGGKFTPLQIKWHQAWRGSVKIAYSPEEAIQQIQSEVKQWSAA
jgi:Holliday junction resolvase